MNQQPPNYNDIPNSKMESYIKPNNTTSETHRMPYTYPHYNPSAPLNHNINPSAPPPPNTYSTSAPPPIPAIDYNTDGNSIQYNSYIVPSAPPNPSQNISETRDTNLNHENQLHTIKSSNQNELNIYPSLDRIEESNSVRLVVPTITNFNSTEEYIGNQFNSETCSFILNNINNKLKEKYLVSNWEYDKSKNINYICVWTTNHLLLAKINIIFYNSQETDAIIPYNLNFRIETDIDVFIKTNWSKIDQENKKLIQQSFILENNNILSVLLSEMSSILKQLSPKKSKFRDLFSQCLGEG